MTDSGVYKCVSFSEPYDFSYRSVNSFVLAVESNQFSKDLKMNNIMYGRNHPLDKKGHSPLPPII